MSINDFLEKVKPFYWLFLIILLFSIVFISIRISILDTKHNPIKIENTMSETGSVINSNSQSEIIIGSKNSKKYYFPWCGTVKMIKPENQIKFGSIEEAKNAGYTKASNCKGLK